MNHVHVDPWTKYDSAQQQRWYNVQKCQSHYLFENDMIITFIRINPVQFKDEHNKI